jgi:hypothetical protein
MGKSKNNNKWLEWDEHQVGNWLKGNGISEEYVTALVGSKIKGKDLGEVISDEDALIGMLFSSCLEATRLTIHFGFRPHRKQILAPKNNEEDFSFDIFRYLNSAPACEIIPPRSCLT